MIQLTHELLRRIDLEIGPHSLLGENLRGNDTIEPKITWDLASELRRNLGNPLSFRLGDVPKGMALKRAPLF